MTALNKIWAPFNSDLNQISKITTHLCRALTQSYTIHTHFESDFYQNFPRLQQNLHLSVIEGGKFLNQKLLMQ